jgi:mannonate dehydratase
MKFTMRWFGESDAVPLAHIAQVPVVTGIVGTLETIPVGEVWPPATLAALQAQVEAAGLRLDVIESIPIAEPIKLGLPARDALIENYCQSIRHLGALGIGTLCYNFMPAFDWMRSDLAHALPDGSFSTRYTQSEIDAYDLSAGLAARVAWAYSYDAAALHAVREAYAAVDSEALFANLAYFLRRVVPVAEECGVRLALHPDDPPWPIFGLPRIVGDAASIARILDVVDSRAHGLTFCTGSLGARAENDLPAMARAFAGRIHFVHMRNVQRTGPRDFVEVAHPSAAGSVDMAAVMGALVESGYDGPIRSDHGRTIWGEGGRVCYGLYDRALGTMYLYGLWEYAARAAGSYFTPTR